MEVAGEGYDALIHALGKIPDDIKLMKMTNLEVETAGFRVIPFIFDDSEQPRIVTCIHPDWFARFDEIIGVK